MSSQSLPFQKAGFLQFNVEAGNVEKNLHSVHEGLKGLSGELDGSSTLITLPELWATGFAYNALDSLIDLIPSVIESIRELAARYNIVLAGSLPEKDQADGKIYNTLYFIDSQGVAATYRKQHLFAPMGEDKHLSPAESLPVISINGAPIAGLVCYDLRFPELVRKQVSQGAELLVVSAQWPLVRKDHWHTLLQARAIENQIFVVASNRCGSDRTGERTTFGGHSMIIAPDGTILFEAGEEEESAIAELDSDLVATVRSRFNSAAPSPYNTPDNSKILDLQTLSSIRKTHKNTGRRVVFTNGCFDILHSGHVTYLEQARNRGDCLVVGLNSDSSIRSIKGPDRPVNSENERARVLAALGCVDYIVLFADDTPIHLIETLTPDVLAKGADWAEDDIVGAAEVKRAGGQVARIPLVPDTSTTSIINKISSQ